MKEQIEWKGFYTGFLTYYLINYYFPNILNTLLAVISFIVIMNFIFIIIDFIEERFKKTENNKEKTK